MNGVDLLLGAIVAIGALVGLRRGLIAGSADLLALAASVVWAFWAYPHGVALIEGQGVRWGVWTAPVAFVVAFLLGRIVLGAVLGRLLAAVPKTAHAHRANRWLGTIPGAANGLIHAIVVAVLLLAIPSDDAFTRSASDSVIANRLAAPAEWLEARLGPIFDPAVEQTLGKLTVKPDSRESVPLRFTVADPKARPELEAQMLALVNDARLAQGLRPLAADAEAATISRAHSRDMFARGYFSHVTPDGATPSDRWARASMRFLAAGENLALARTLPMAHQGLMNSPGHRANILRPTYGRVGIGIVDGGRYGLMVTQTFRN